MSLTRPHQANAVAFCIWRIGKPLNWQCTAIELAEQTGFSISTVRKHCKERKWPILHGYQRRFEKQEKRSLTTIMHKV